MSSDANSSDTDSASSLSSDSDAEEGSKTSNNKRKKERLRDKWKKEFKSPEDLVKAFENYHFSNNSKKALDASDPKILSSVIGANETHLYKIDEQHGNWLDCIQSRKQPISPVEIGHMACVVCLISHIAMKIPRKLKWNPIKENFNNDKEANRLLSRSQRKPYGTGYLNS